MSNLYYRLCKNYKENKLIPITESPYDYTNDDTIPWFTSCYLYNEDHKLQFETTGSFAGITDNFTNKLWWDFDSKDLAASQKDTQALVELLLRSGCTDKNIQICFSGNKGFSVVVRIDKYLVRKQIEEVCSSMAKGLATFDTSVYDNQRIFRLVGTINEKSGLYKIPLTLSELYDANLNNIKEHAKNGLHGAEQDSNKVKWSIPDSLITPIQEKKVVVTEKVALDWGNKPKWLSNCRWALQNGYFKEGERSYALLVLGSSYKNQGFSLDHNYRFLKGVAELQSKVNNTDRYPDEEIYNNIMLQIYSDSWNNGQSSCKEKGSWLECYCNGLGDHKCKQVEQNTVNMGVLHGLFETYLEDFDKNILYSGIPSLDKKIKFRIGTSNGVLAAPSAGKTSFALQMLNYNSKKEINSLFCSYDVFFSGIYLKLIQTQTGFTEDQIYKIYKTEAERKQKFKEILESEYKNLEFCFKSGQSTQEISDMIDEYEKRKGKLKLLVIDYNELISSEFSDATASSAQTAQRIRQIAHDKQVCIITLMQPTKEFFDPSKEMYTFAAAKGSGAIAQSLTVMLGISRPGFDVFHPENDVFSNISCLKNRNGPLFSLDLSWNGIKGIISEISDEKRNDLKELRQKKEEQKILSQASGW